MTDHYYVSVRDGDRTIPVLGPFLSEELCKEYAYGNKRIEIVNACCEIDPKAHFYEYGMFRLPMAEMCPFDYHAISVLNKANPEKWDGVLS
jgi:hypothetical protein